VATPVTMPMLGLTMEEGTVAEWLKQEGESVAKDEPLLTVEMDKGTLEVPSPAAGILRRIVVQVGTTVPVRTLIAEIGAPDEVMVRPSSTESPPGPVGSQPMSVAGGGGDPDRSSADAARASSPSVAMASSHASGAPASSPAATRESNGQRLFASPRARMRARALMVDLAQLHGSGPHGRIVEADVLASSSSGQAASATISETRLTATPLARKLAQERGVAVTDLAGTGPGGRVTQDDVLRAAVNRPASEGAQPLSRVRRITAERMAASTAATARVTLFLDADFSEAGRFRTQLQPEFARLGVPRLPWDALIARAAGLALVDHTAVLGQWVDGQSIRTPEAVHVGVAVALEPEGLVVPVLRDVATRSLRELAADLLGLVDKARAGRLGPAEMQDGAFTITNLGAYRVDGFTPIINPPETAILGVGRIADKAVVVGGQVEARLMCTLSLSFDHRVVDGVPAAAFLARLAELLERPYALLGI
jgi:pyruvate dehydrogenase E2 component (dihydrolipoamide acetyltransferase)